MILKKILNRLKNKYKQINNIDMGKKHNLIKKFIFEGKKIEVSLGSENHNLSNVVPKEGLYEPWVVKYFEIVSSFYGKDKDAVDIGANVGIHTILLSFLQSKGKVIAFEPLPFIVKELESNIQKNSVKNIIVEKKIVSDISDSELYINMPFGGNVGSSYVSNTKSTHIPSQKMDVTTLDDYLESQSNLDVKIIKIDVEKWESYVLRGLKQSIEKYEPVVFLEFNVDCKDITNEKIGFELYIEIKKLFKYIFLIERLNFKVIQINSFSELRGMMLTGHFVEDLICFNDDDFFDFIKPHSINTNFSCYHGARSIMTNDKKGFISSFEHYLDDWCYEHSFFLSVQNQNEVNIQLSLSNTGPFEENKILVYIEDSMEEMNLKRETISKTYKFEAHKNSSLYIFVEKVFLAKEHINLHDPRTLGIKVEIKEL